MDGVKNVSVVVPTKIIIVLHDNVHNSQLQIGNFLQRLILLLVLCILFLFLFALGRTILGMQTTCYTVFVR